ncbi:ferredoxin [Sedimentibacter sp. MB31-C6]|uniref:ferredoxin n=1 Tax=Sedimentibacter sp. MB31-C6 TaxID=3109366 RepID=UPI002DDD043B|nr:ferredoxin [Sedimentibacter sp. MB36-C1]WSI04004.1 ferredoxin [Sedimentibacter sp. MB36-C1]
MKAFVDRDTCIGCGVCVALCPDVFELDDENISVVISDPVPTEFESCAEESKQECPVGAITVE